MLKNIINTVFVRVFGAVISLVIVVINSNQTGAEGLGIISLIVLAISIFIIVNGFASGSLVYFIPRENIFKLLMISYSGVFITGLFFTAVLKLVDIAPEEYHLHIIILSVFLSISGIHEKVLIGKENIIQSNIVSLIKFLIQILSLCLFYYVFLKKTVDSYVYSLYLSYIAEWILLLIFSFKYITYSGVRGLYPLFKKVFQLSGYNTLALIIQKLNYRLSYYLIEYFFGLKTLGYFSAGIQISESTLIIGRSVSFVQYSKISNLNNRDASAKITVLFVKLMFVISGLFMVVLSLLPSTVYTFLFGDDFILTQDIIISLSIGIIALSCTTVISPFFSGTGNHKLNTWSAFAGFIMTLIAGILFIPLYDVIGAGITATLSYLVTLFFQLYLFGKLTEIKFHDFYINKKDITYAVQSLKQKFVKPKSIS
jgi:O-antigen/teichoic acid export membrane protein